MNLIDIPDDRKVVMTFNRQQLLFLKWALADYCVKLDIKSQNLLLTNHHEYAQWLSKVRALLTMFEKAIS